MRKRHATLWINKNFCDERELRRVNERQPRDGDGRVGGDLVMDVAEKVTAAAVAVPKDSNEKRLFDSQRTLLSNRSGNRVGALIVIIIDLP
jgi:hypothetical protein